MTADELLAGHPKLVGRIRQIFRDGATLPDVIRLIRESLSLQSGGRVAVAYCLAQAFGFRWRRPRQPEPGRVSPAEPGRTPRLTPISGH